MLSEEEIIKQIKNDLYVGEFYGITEDAIKGLLDLYNKQKEETEELNSEFAINTEIHKRDMRIKELEEVNNCLHETNNNYISKDKIRNLLPKINGSISHFKSKNDNHIVKRIKRMLEDLIKE